MRGIILDPDSYNGIQRLTREQKGELLDAIFLYNSTWEILEMCDLTWMAFDMMRGFFDKQKIQYKEKCEKNRENAEKRWQYKNANASDGKKTMPIEWNKTKPKEEEPKETKQSEVKWKEKKVEITISTKNETPHFEIKKNSFEESEILFKILKERIDDNPKEIEKELVRFYNHWTAPMKSWTLLWRSEKTFAFRMRLENWLWRCKEKPDTSFIYNKKKWWTGQA